MYTDKTTCDLVEDSMKQSYRTELDALLSFPINHPMIIKAPQNAKFAQPMPLVLVSSRSFPTTEGKKSLDQHQTTTPNFISVNAGKATP